MQPEWRSLYVIIPVIALVLVISALWYWLVERPFDRADPEYAARHCRPLTPSLGPPSPPPAEYDWPEGWTDDQLAELHGDQAEPPHGSQPWDFSAWETEQAEWKARRVAEAHRYDVALASGAWADPWWTRRR